MVEETPAPEPVSPPEVEPPKTFHIKQEAQLVTKRTELHHEDLPHIPQFKPWHVTLYIRMTESMESLEPRVFFVRAHGAYDAVAEAVKLWNRWFRPGGETPSMFGPKFPCIEDRMLSMCIDEGDWREMLKQAHKMEARDVNWFKYSGMRLNPVGFTFKDAHKCTVVNFNPDKHIWKKKGFRKNHDQAGGRSRTKK
jgi:hypothetical protein